MSVAVADAPSGPFRDLVGRPLVAKADLPPTDNPMGNLDPMIVVADGIPHMIWGNGTCYAAPLAADLRSLAGPIDDRGTVVRGGRASPRARRARLHRID